MNVRTGVYGEIPKDKYIVKDDITRDNFGGLLKN